MPDAVNARLRSETIARRRRSHILDIRLWSAPGRTSSADCERRFSIGSNTTKVSPSLKMDAPLPSKSRAAPVPRGPKGEKRPVIPRGVRMPIGAATR
jgi:hypothetical protein